MALINCPECGKEVSDNASKCPNCGCKLKSVGKIAIIIVLVILLVCMGSYAMYKHEQKINQPSPEMQEWLDEFDKKMERSKENTEKLKEEQEEWKEKFDYIMESYD